MARQEMEHDILVIVWLKKRWKVDGTNRLSGWRVGIGGEISLTQGAWELWKKVRLARKCNPLR